MKNKKILFLLAIFAILFSIIITPQTHYININSEDIESNKIQDILRSSSKNGYGYNLDTNTSYSWIEISQTGINMSDISEKDDYYQKIDILSEGGWSFKFFNTIYNDIYVSTNGWMSFTNLGDTNTMIEDIPSSKLENIDCIALFGEDLNPCNFENGGGDIFYNFSGIAPNRYLVIEYYQVFDFRDEALIGDFEAILYENGTIKFQYKNINKQM